MPVGMLGEEMGTTKVRQQQRTVSKYSVTSIFKEDTSCSLFLANFTAAVHEMSD